MTNKDRVNILLVDDQPSNLLVMKTILDSLDENLICANSGEEALRAVLQAEFAVILLDVRMPTMNGFETARLIRSRARSSHVAILFITASIDAVFPVEDAYALGAVDYLSKPILPAVLCAKVAFFVELYRKTQELAKLERARHLAALDAKDQRIRLGEQRFSLLVNSSGEGIFGIDVDTSCTFLNTAGAAMLGYQPDELVGKPVHTVILARKTTDDVIARAIREGVAVRVQEEIFHRKDGSAFPVAFSVSPMLVNGRTEGAVVTFTDITERKRTEDELRRVAAELSASDRRKTEFLATLAHELRNPLAPLRNGLQVMRLAHNDEVAVAKARDVMERQLTLMVHLVNDLLDVARISNGTVDLKKKAVIFSEVVNSAVETCMPLIETAKHQFNSCLPEESIVLTVDPMRIAQVIGNLLNNAAKYTPPGGRIELKAWCVEGELHIAVVDTGIGIPVESQETVFDMFAQLKPAADRAQGGLGVGLTLARRLVELHGGTLRGESPGPGQGSTFVIRLPMVENDGLLLPVVVPDIPERAPTTMRVLIVDDNADAAETFSTMLEVLGHTTQVANSGSEALACVAEFHPDVIFLDIGMPGMDGYEVARQLKKTAALEATFLIALTGWGTEKDRARSRQAGFDHHLTKPVALASVNALFAELAWPVKPTG